jgi:branched-chain amino acid aminotransferase
MLASSQRRTRRAALRSARFGGTCSVTRSGPPPDALPAARAPRSATICRFDRTKEDAAMSMAQRDGWIWYDGKLVPWREATTHVLTHTLHYGMGVFEGVRCYATGDGPAIFRLADHTDRLFRSAQIFGMKIPFGKDEVSEAQKECVRKNKLDACYIRPIAFYGSHAMGVAAKTNPVLLAIAAWPWGAYLGADGLEKGIRVKTSSYTHHHPNVTMCKAKAVGNYPVSILANQEATHDGYDEVLTRMPRSRPSAPR